MCTGMRKLTFFGFQTAWSEMSIPTRLFPVKKLMSDILFDAPLVNKVLQSRQASDEIRYR